MYKDKFARARVFATTIHRISTGGIACSDFTIFKLNKPNLDREVLVMQQDSGPTHAFCMSRDDHACIGAQNGET